LLAIDTIFPCYLLGWWGLLCLPLIPGLEVACISGI